MARGQQATQLVVPVFEGQRLDRYRITFAGSLELDPTDPDDLDLINRLKLGEEVALRVEGAIVSRPHNVTRDKNGWIKTVRGGCTVSVHSLDMRSVKRTREAQRPAGPNDDQGGLQVLPGGGGDPAPPSDPAPDAGPTPEDPL
jgi:hypothetical protein